MTRRFKFGDIFIEDDSLVSQDGFSKGKRRYVVSATPGQVSVNVRKITSLKGKENKTAKGAIVKISKKNPTLTQESGLTKKEYKYTYRSGKKERLEEKHIKSNPVGRLNAADMDILRNFKKNKKRSE